MARMWITEKTIQKTMFPFPNTCRQTITNFRKCPCVFRHVFKLHPGPHYDAVCMCVCVCTYHSQHREEDDRSQAGVGGVSTCVNVWVPFLIQFQHTQSSNHVHERGVCRERLQTSVTHLPFQCISGQKIRTSLLPIINSILGLQNTTERD